MSKSALEEALAAQIRFARLPEPKRQFCFAKALGKRWAWDFCWPEFKVAVEVDGGNWTGGAHSRGQGSAEDARKRAVAVLLGWQVVSVHNHEIDDGYAMFLIQALLGEHDAEDAAQYLAAHPCSKCDIAGTQRRQRQRRKARENE